jgi:hypothetical protein
VNRRNKQVVEADDKKCSASLQQAVERGSGKSLIWIGRRADP